MLGPLAPEAALALLRDRAPGPHDDWASLAEAADARRSEMEARDAEARAAEHARREVEATQRDANSAIAQATAAETSASHRLEELVLETAKLRESQEQARLLDSMLQ